MTPVIIGGATLYLGDCREILPTRGKIEAIITDPPYGIGYVHGGGGKGSTQYLIANKAKTKASGHARPVAGDDVPFDPSHLLAASDNVLMFGADHFYPRLPDSGRWLVWDKLDGLEAWDSFSDVECAWHSKEGAARIFSFRWKGVVGVKRGEDNGNRCHPTQKPIALMAWCIEQAGGPAVITDPYMGSGTTGVAAAQAGLQFVGMETDERHFESACKRIEQAVAQGQLFATAPMKQEQSAMFSEAP